MKIDEQHAVRDVLAAMIAEAPPTTDFENLKQLQVVRTTNRPDRSPLVATVAGFVIALAIVGAVVAVAQRPASVSISPGSGAAATIFMVPDVVPDDLELSLAEVWIDGNSTTQIYLLPGRTSWDEGDRVVNININDMIKQAGDDDSLRKLVAGEPQALFETLQRQLEDTYSDSQLTFDEITVRGRPALVAQRITIINQGAPNEATNIAIGVIVLEGNGIISEIDSHQIARDIAIAIAESLTPMSAEDFDTYASAQQ